MLGLCREYHKLPSEIEAEDGEFLRLIGIEKYGKVEHDEEVSTDDG